MKCKCGETEIVYMMAFGPMPMRLGGAEIGRVHSQDRCGWGYECHDCWGDKDRSALADGWFHTEAVARQLLDVHLAVSCNANIRARSELA